MAFSNYAELLQEIEDRLHRDDLNDKIPSYIALAEEIIFRELRTYTLESEETITVTGGTNTASPPSGTRRIKWVKLDGTKSAPLTYIPMPMLQEKYDLAGTGTPRHYSWDGSNIIIGPTPADDVDIIANCTITPSGLSPANTSNSILTNYPSIYFYGALYEAYCDTRNKEQADKAEKMLYQAIARANKESRKRNHSGTPALPYTFKRRIP